MVNKRTIFAVLLSAFLAAAPVIAQEEGEQGGGEPTPGQCAVCQTVIATITACADDITCVCSGDNVANVAACTSCVTDAGVETTAFENFDIVEGHAAQCAASGDNSTSTTSNASSTSTTSQSSSTSSRTSTSTTSTGTSPASTTSPPPRNGAMALSGGAGVLTAVLALAVGIAL